MITCADEARDGGPRAPQRAIRLDGRLWDCTGAARTESARAQECDVLAGIHFCLAVIPSDVIRIEVLGPGVLQFVEWNAPSDVLHARTRMDQKRSEPSRLRQTKHPIPFFAEERRNTH